MSEPLLEQVDAVEQFDDERRAFCVDAEVALEADEFADAEGDFASEEAFVAGLGVDDAELDEAVDEGDVDAAADGDVLHAE
jgi:hypothetical protein